MGDVFPELKDNEKKIKAIIEDEEASFENTLAKVILVSSVFAEQYHHFGPSDVCLSTPSDWK
jgi:alanyl-tRNA synthetase